MQVVLYTGRKTVAAVAVAVAVAVFINHTSQPSLLLIYMHYDE